MRNTLKYLIFIVISVTVLGACSTSSTGRSQLVLKSDAALAQEGARQFAIIRAKMPLVQDRATIDYVACVADAIVGVLDGDDAAMYWELAVIDQPDINAFVLPGGKISVFSGILTVAENQNQLAAVLGHEVAHVTEKHANERASRAAVTYVGVDIASILLGGGYSDQTRAANQALGTGAMLGVLNPFSRMQESEADLVGLHYMAKAGFDPRESVDLWQNMNEKNKTQVPEFLSTHPSGDTRIESLVAALPEALAYYNEAKAQGKEPNCAQ
ncbi:MAG: M48 family metallopeptidase [Gammaproteobacteria bacterium]|nr:M48 family metallopeptidase [Gammaproteobacteria bacterium]MDH4314601.1 M48 family metallopeptidase [Gammaproteobacteria bacterium]MDH5214413.1 M48 family metallopeptidase [Gammaproteobacteria bacterium]MDH5499858.1 M48 family metallopeptidase [Gammaproteobacteria bacterium]